MTPDSLTTSGSSLAPGQWWIGLSGWVLADGNYTDFVTGDRRQFALEFTYSRSARLRPVPGSSRSCRYTGRATAYDVTGPLRLSAPEQMGDAFVLDFGLSAYSSWMVLDDLEPPRADQWLSGEVSLNVDPFEYMDRLAGLPGIPPLIYTWTVEEIKLDTTPCVRVDYGHPLYPHCLGPDEGPTSVPDPSRESWQSVPRTHARQYDNSYRLRCTLEAAESTDTMALSGARSPYGPIPSS